MIVYTKVIANTVTGGSTFNVRYTAGQTWANIIGSGHTSAKTCNASVITRNMGTIDKTTSFTYGPGLWINNLNIVNLAWAAGSKSDTSYVVPSGTYTGVNKDVQISSNNWQITSRI